MFNLRVKTWEDWETLCIYWMKEIAWWGHRVDTNYQTYGRPGQKQHGVDIKPVLPGCGIVGQSKFIQGSFTLKDLNAELDKTDNYPGPITDYYLLTTAEKCTSIQNASSYERISHTRQDGSFFYVHVYYWSDRINVDFLPKEVKYNLFPEAKALFDTESEKSTNSSTLSPDMMLDKLDKLKRLIRNTFSEENIKWLETWNFRSYKIYSRDYDVFSMAYLDWTMIEVAMRTNNPKVLRAYLNNASRINFYATWPVSQTFFYALEEFRKIAYNHYNTGALDGDETFLTVSDLKHRDSVAHQMECAASYLSQVIRNIQQ
ncbi:TPA: hypothetical protein I4D15_14350 [Enterobacter bugandensis]|uniref:hypothetical protein n=1 Tax=Enterobacter TaxID=547 RepID=UPI0013FF578B|nr:MULTISPECIES: hypothetical protein [Enterobacter]EGT5696114.1 hypothetical protein [Cronobacter sakazakii]EGT5721024.1 hypothetical protein [Cronobacter sakazakii]EJG0682860.1 hypothetical protein [Cronobacter sakazakii]EJG0827290.1 hypothetical protein [Cronobacter sakazakii]EJQ2009489.1 hypothetical protein [Cronobacter sakazakii]